jgi:hypothetical protein
LKKVFHFDSRAIGTVATRPSCGASTTGLTWGSASFSSAFGGDVQAEAAHHQRELALATAKLAEAIPGIEIQAYFVDFEVIWDAEATSSQLLGGRDVA